MKRVAVFQHVPYEILGTLHPLIREAGIRVRYVNYGRQEYPDLDVTRYDGLIILGGPMGVYEHHKYPHLKHEIQHIRAALEKEMPILGICLGAQLIAAALGAEVFPSGKREIGWYDVSLTAEGSRDPLFCHFNKKERVFQWHGDTFELPAGAKLLARSAQFRQQAFRYKKNVYGLQFHVEADEPMIERWLRVPIHREEMGKHGFDPEAIRKETHKRIEAQKQLGRKTWTEYVRLFSGRAPRPKIKSAH